MSLRCFASVLSVSLVLSMSPVLSAQAPQKEPAKDKTPEPMYKNKLQAKLGEKLVGTWKASGRFDEYWTIAPEGNAFAITGTFWKNGKEVGAAHGTQVSLGSENITFKRVFDKKPEPKLGNSTICIFKITDTGVELIVGGGSKAKGEPLTRAEAPKVVAKEAAKPAETKAKIRDYLGVWTGTFAGRTDQLSLNIGKARDEWIVEAYVLSADNKRLSYFRELHAKTDDDGKSMTFTPMWVEKSAPIAAGMSLTLTPQPSALRAEFADAKKGDKLVVELKKGDLKQYAQLTPPAEPKGKAAAKLIEPKTAAKQTDADGSMITGGLMSGMGFIQQGKTIVCCMSGGDIQYWDVEKRERIKLIKGNLAMNGFVVSPDGRQLARSHTDVLSKGEGVIQLFDADTADIKYTLKGHSHGTYHLAYSADSHWIVSADKKSFIDERPPSIKIWDATTGELAVSIAANGGPLAFSPDGQKLACAGFKEGGATDDFKNAVFLTLYDLKGKALGTIVTPHKQWINAITFSHDGKQVATVGEDGMVTTLSLATRKPVKSTELIKIGQKLNRRLETVLFSADDKQLIVGQQDGMLYVCDAKTLAEVKSERFERRSVRFLQFSPAGKLAFAVTSSGGGKIVLRDAQAEP